MAGSAEGGGRAGEGLLPPRYSSGNGFLIRGGRGGARRTAKGEGQGELRGKGRGNCGGTAGAALRGELPTIRFTITPLRSYDQLLSGWTDQGVYGRVTVVKYDQSSGAGA